MRFGTFFFFQAAPGLTHEEVVHRELEQMEWTEELGFDQIWLTEHHFIDYGLSVDPAALASAAASRTSRVRIGLAAAILPFHHPLRLAEQLALVDVISKGRLDIGVGRGNRPAEFKGYHVPAAGEPRALRRGGRHHAAGLDRGALLLRRAVLHHQGRPRHSQARPAAAPDDLPGVRQRQRGREHRRARLAHAQLDPDRPGRARS